MNALVMVANSSKKMIINGQSNPEITHKYLVTDKQFDNIMNVDFDHLESYLHNKAVYKLRLHVKDHPTQTIWVGKYGRIIPLDLDRNVTLRQKKFLVHQKFETMKEIDRYLRKRTVKRLK